MLLYNPRAVFFTMPLGLMSVASNLDPSRFEVRIVDGRLEPDPIEALAALVDERCLCLGVSVLTGAPLLDALEVSRAFKRRFPRLPVVWGGWHPSLFGRECLEEPTVDVTVQGQGEATFAELVERLALGETARQGVSVASGKMPTSPDSADSTGLDLAGCAGIHWRAAPGRIHAESPRPMTSVDRLPPTDYALIDVERYFELKGRRQLDFIASQGCYWRCAFCADPEVYGRGWSGLDAPTLTRRVLELHDRYGFTDLNFQDETFFTRIDACLAFADALVGAGRGFTWAATMRADQGDRIDEAGFARLAASGLRRLLVGVESGSQEMLDWMRKDIRLEQVWSTAEKCRRHGIAVEFPFIVGFPGEDDASVDASLRFAMRLRALSPDFQTPFFYFKPYPGSAITAQAARDGHQLPVSLEDWGRFDLYGSAGPWVSPARFELVERFKFYQRIAWDRPPNAIKALLAKVARWRCRHGMYGLPVEASLSRRFRPRARLS